ncbi:PAS domain S-box protein [Porticoccus sp.]|uniref:PAS domain S-box protein n=1 Tax=Porticoccus sp. TaxID=2024853 RepID=UPI003F69E9AC
MLDISRDAVIEIDTSSCVIGWNRAAETIFLINAEYALGKNLADLIIPSGDRAAHHEGMKRFLESDSSEIVNQISDLKAIRGDGSLFPVELTVRYIEHPEGNRFVGLVRDLTERKQIEARLLEIAKLESIGLLTGGLAHDFNNLLCVIIGNLELLGQQPLVGESKENVQSAMDAAVRASQVTLSLMAIARREPMDLAVYDMNLLLVGLKHLVHSTIGSLAEIRWQLSPESIMVEVDSGSFSSALLNLVLNARDAMRDCPKKIITISTGILEVKTQQRGNLPPGRYARLEVADTGKGMNSATRGRALEPFYTTKERGHGTGLGLPMVYGFARQLKGCLELETTENSGTLVSIYLPYTEKSAESIKAAQRGMFAPVLGAGVVLVVDDEVLLCKLACRLFESLGYRAIPAASAVEATGVLEKQSVDLIFSDISLPGGINGIELAEQVVELYPQIPVILSTGYSEELVERNASQWIVVQKPYLKKDIVEVLFKVSLAL